MNKKIKKKRLLVRRLLGRRATFGQAERAPIPYQAIQSLPSSRFLKPISVHKFSKIFTFFPFSRFLEPISVHNFPTSPPSLVFLETPSDFLSRKTSASFFHKNHSLSPLPGSRENFCPLISQNITTFPLFRVLERILFNEYAFFYSCWFFRLDFW